MKPERRPRQEPDQERQPEQPHHAQDQPDEQARTSPRGRTAPPASRTRARAARSRHRDTRPPCRWTPRGTCRAARRPGREQAGVGAPDRGHAAQVRVRQRLREQHQAERDPAGDVVPEPREVVGRSLEDDSCRARASPHDSFSSKTLGDAVKRPVAAVVICGAVHFYSAAEPCICGLCDLWLSEEQRCGTVSVPCRLSAPALPDGLLCPNVASRLRLMAFAACSLGPLPTSAVQSCQNARGPGAGAWCLLVPHRPLANGRE